MKIVNFLKTIYRQPKNLIFTKIKWFQKMFLILKNI